MYAAGLPPDASWLRRSEAASDAGKDCAVELGLARVTGITAATNLARFADELINHHPMLLALLEAGRVLVWNIHTVLNETRVLSSCAAQARRCAVGRPAARHELD